MPLRTQKILHDQQLHIPPEEKEKENRAIYLPGQKRS
jgi:hypothetical protein